MKTVAMLLVCLMLLSGCASMATHEKNKYQEIKQVGAPCDKAVDPGAAAVLNILPGFGDVYLATGEAANSSNWGAFVLDLLFWPISVVWAVPQGAITAGEINKIECVGYYTYNENGKAELQKLKTQAVPKGTSEQTDKPAE